MRKALLVGAILALAAVGAVALGPALFGENFRTVVRERKLREFDPTVRVLESCVADPGFADEDAGVRDRISETLALVSSLSSWSEQMLHLEPATLMKILKLGNRIQKLIGDGKSKSS